MPSASAPRVRKKMICGPRRMAIEPDRRADVDEQPVVVGGRRADEHRVDHVERREIDDAGVRAGGGDTALRTLRRRRAWPPTPGTRGRRRRDPASLKLTCASSIGNGAALRTCQRISWARSCARGGTCSNRTSETLATGSGTTSPTRFGRPIASSARATAPPTSARSRMFCAVSDGTTAPSGSGSTA